MPSFFTTPGSYYTHRYRPLSVEEITKSVEDHLKNILPVGIDVRVFVHNNIPNFSTDFDIELVDKSIRKKKPRSSEIKKSKSKRPIIDLMDE